MKVVQRLEFENIFPDEEKKATLEYLAKVPKEALLKTVGYFNTRPLPNFDRFFSNREIHDDIVNRVVNYWVDSSHKCNISLIFDSCCKNFIRR